MAVPVKSLKDVLLEFLGELRDTKVEAQKNGLASIDYAEEIEVTARLIVSGGENALKRVAISAAGIQVKREVMPEVKETTVAGKEVATEQSEATVTKDESEKNHEQYTVNGTSGGDRVRTDQEIETA